MDDPFHFLRTDELITLVVVTAGLTALCARFFTPLATTEARRGIVSLQLAGNWCRAHAIVASWRAERLHGAAARAIKLDFLLILLYVSALGLLGLLAGRVGDEESAGTWLAVAAVAAGICDCIENIGLLAMVNGRKNPAIAPATTALAVLKFLLLLVSVLGSVGIFALSALGVL